jgi:glycosyltransferase involved in cell wall biosynthesis
MNIAYVINSSNIGGSELHTLYLASGMVKNGHKVVVFCPQGILVNQFKKNGSLVVIDSIKFDIDLGYITRLNNYFSKNSIQVVHCHELKPVINGLIAAKMAGVNKRIAHIHSPLPKWQIPLYKKIPDIVANSLIVNICATDVIALNQASKRLRIYGEFVRPSLIKVIPNGLDLKYLEPPNIKQNRAAHHSLTRLYNIPDNSFILGTLSRLTVEKGVTLLVNAMSQIKNRSPEIYKNTYALIAGTGILESEIKRQIKSLSLDDHVILTGFVADDFKPTFLQGLDLFVFPTLHEGFGYVLIEAMAALTPTLSSNIPVLVELTENGTYGKHFRVNNIDDLATQICAAISMMPNEEELVRIQNLINDRYNLKEFINNYELLYQGKLKA